MEQVTLNVTGMSCGGCENAVRRAVGSIEGVTTVTASHKNHRVTVEYDPAKASLARITQAIGTAGYQVV
jgi:copper ion binding protein